MALTVHRERDSKHFQELLGKGGNIMVINRPTTPPASQGAMQEDRDDSKVPQEWADQIAQEAREQMCGLPLADASKGDEQ